MPGNFTFIHAADIHLDSPLHGLSRKDEDFSRLVRGATRKAFSNVVDLAIEEGAAFVVIAGDLYDGAWKDQSTGQFAIAQLARLARAGIRSVIVFGNHDADSRVTRHLTAPEGVYKLKSAKCETVCFDDLGVAIHGRPLAARVSVEVDGPLAQRLKADPAWFEAEVRGHAAGVSDALWIERVKIVTRDTTLPMGLPLELQELLAQALEDPDCRRAVESAVAPLTAKLPADIDDPDIAPLLASARARDGEALVRAARALVEARLGEGAD